MFFNSQIISAVRPTVNTYSSQNGGISHSNRENLKTPDWRFNVDGKRSGNGAFLKRWRLVTSCPA